jgi:acetyl esterase/lipase
MTPSAVNVSRICLACLFVFSGLSSAKEPAKQKKKKSPAVPEGVVVRRDLEYAKPDGVSLKLDLYLPESEPGAGGKLPVVVWVHGGGWLNGSKDNCKAAWLAAEGFAVASINYRLTDVAQWPAQIDDCYAAVRWLRSNAEKYQLDPDHIGAWGGSAGGHLVALMGTRRFPGKEKISSQVQAVCDWYGPSELLTMPPNTLGNGRTLEDIAKSNGAKLLGATVRDIPEKAKDASALDNVSKDDPPFLIMHGSADPGVPVEQSTRLHEKLKAAGVSSELRIIEGAGHGGPLFNTDEARETVWRFFVRTLKPKPEA